MQEGDSYVSGLESDELMWCYKAMPDHKWLAQLCAQAGLVRAISIMEQTFRSPDYASNLR